jgi:hypothetical protein
MLRKSLLGSSAAMPDATSWTERESEGVNLGAIEGWVEPKPTGPSSTGASTLCIDCKIETQPKNPGATHDYQQFIVTDEVWQAAGMPLGKVDPKSFVLKGGGGCLCLTCIERRLGGGSQTSTSFGRSSCGQTETPVGSHLSSLTGSRLE